MTEEELMGKESIMNEDIYDRIIRMKQKAKETVPTLNGLHHLHLLLGSKAYFDLCNYMTKTSTLGEVTGIKEFHGMPVTFRKDIEPDEVKVVYV